MRFPTDVEHALAVVNLYFTLKPKRWIYEPLERFNYLGREYAWNPDCVFVYQKKVYVCEYQRTRISGKRWERKWRVYNLYFARDFFHTAKFQEWSPNVIYPQFLCISNQAPEVVKNGFEIRDRNLIVCREFK